MATDLHRTFVSLLESLPDPHRQLLTLHELNGLNPDGISRVLGITRAQARIALLRARLAMRLRLFDHMRAVSA
jgi:DNA-directed RNA polymerase specialized sigma24 family protein